MRKAAWVLLVAVGSASVAGAAPVKEYVDPETGALVFDASGENTDFVAPDKPREFADVGEYLKWVLKRFHGRPILNEKGELIDVQGAWVLLGQPKYEFEGVTQVVTQPVVQTISGPFGFVLIGGQKYEMPLDASPPPIEEIEPAFYSLVVYRRSCAGAPLTGFGYCVVGAAFKHIYLFYQSIGGTMNVAGKAIVAPSTNVSLTLLFRDAFGRRLNISTPTTTQGRATISARSVGGVGLAEWGVFGNPFIDPTKQLVVNGQADGPRSDGALGQADIFWTQIYP